MWELRKEDRGNCLPVWKPIGWCVLALRRGHLRKSLHSCPVSKWGWGDGWWEQTSLGKVTSRGPWTTLASHLIPRVALKVTRLSWTFLMSFYQIPKSGSLAFNQNPHWHRPSPLEGIKMKCLHRNHCVDISFLPSPIVFPHPSSVTEQLTISLHQVFWTV